MPPPFKTTSELLAYAQKNPQTLRDKWWEYYVACDTNRHFRILLPVCGEGYAGWKQDDEDLSKGMISYIMLKETFKPIPCPHFIFRYNTNWLPLLDGLKLPTAEYHAACNIAAAQPKHALTLCIQDAWKIDEEAFNDYITIWLFKDVEDSLIATGYDLNLSKNLLQSYVNLLVDSLFTPAIAHQKEVFLAGHRERGLLNKELFNK